MPKGTAVAEKPAAAQPLQTCAHHWIIEPETDSDNMFPACCRNCHTEKRFVNTLPYEEGTGATTFSPSEKLNEINEARSKRKPDYMRSIIKLKSKGYSPEDIATATTLQLSTVVNYQTQLRKGERLHQEFDLKGLLALLEQDAQLDDICNSLSVPKITARQLITHTRTCPRCIP